MTAPINVVRASPTDLSTVLSLLVDTARWLHARGVNQWHHYLDEDTEPELAEAIAGDEVFLALVDGEPAATISVQLAPGDWDRDLWGDVPADEAVYIHRFAVRREYAGTGLGAALLDWAEGYAREHGRRLLRLDCVGHNERLNEYYRQRLTFAGECETYGMTFSRYQKELAQR